jgi:AAA domain
MMNLDDAKLANGIALADFAPAMDTGWDAPTLGDWIADPSLLEPPHPLVDDLIWEARSTILSGLPKCGKTTLACQVSAALSNGGVVFGRRVQPTPVVWLALDEALGDTVRRLLRFGANTLTTRVTNERPKRPGNLVDLCRRSDSRLVIVDTLARWWFGDVKKSGDAEDVREFLVPWIDALRDASVASLPLHHTSKSGVRGAGSYALEAEPDACLVLVHPAQRRMLHADADDADRGDVSDTDDGRRILQGTSRFTPHIKLSLRFDGEQFSVDGQAESRRTRVLRAAEIGNRTKSDLADAAGGKRQKTLQLVDALRDEGALHEEHGRYRLTDRGLAELADAVSVRDTATEDEA